MRYALGLVLLAALLTALGVAFAIDSETGYQYSQRTHQTPGSGGAPRT